MTTSAATSTKLAADLTLVEKRAMQQQKEQEKTMIRMSNRHRLTAQTNNIAPAENTTQLISEQSELQQVAASLPNGYVLDYSCERVVGDQLSFETLPIYFDYEFTALKSAPSIVWPPGSPTVNPNAPIPTQPAMEWGTLWTVSNSLGLHGCNLNDHPILSQGSTSGNTTANYVVSLSSLQVDTEDPGKLQLSLCAAVSGSLLT